LEDPDFGPGLSILYTLCGKLILMNRNCHKCGKGYEYDDHPNIMLFCPECGHFDYMCCDIGFGPVAPCSICRGREILGEVVTKDNGCFLMSERFSLDQELTGRYNEALMEAGRIIDGLINK